MSHWDVHWTSMEVPHFNRVMLVHLGRPLDVQMKMGTDGPKTDVQWTSDGRWMPTGLNMFNGTNTQSYH